MYRVSWGAFCKKSNFTDIDFWYLISLPQVLVAFSSKYPFSENCVLVLWNIIQTLHMFHSYLDRTHSNNNLLLVREFYWDLLNYLIWKSAKQRVSDAVMEHFQDRVVFSPNKWTWSTSEAFLSQLTAMLPCGVLQSKTKHKFVVVFKLLNIIMQNIPAHDIHMFH